MARSVIKEGKNVDEAIALALAELGIELEDADVEILEEGSKAVLGIFGGKGAKVQVTEHVTDTKKINAFLEAMLDVIGIEARIETREESDKIFVDVYGENVGALIGKHGDTLYAISYLANLIINKGRENYKRVIVDVEHYREQREEVLVSMANKAAERVMRYKRPVQMQPMPAAERRIVHATLQANRMVETESTGEEPNRCVVVKIRPYTKVI
jgi:spoIIIJ-associated protein